MWKRWGFFVDHDLVIIDQEMLQTPLYENIEWDLTSISTKSYIIEQSHQDNMIL